MNWNPTQDPERPASGTNSIETLIIPRARDIGGFDVGRALPSPERQMVGPFIVFDQMVFRPGDKLTIKAGPRGARLMALGGATMNESRYIWWNFVSSSKDRIEQAKEDWKAADWQDGPFKLPKGDDAEFIPITPELDRTRPRLRTK